MTEKTADDKIAEEIKARRGRPPKATTDDRDDDGDHVAEAVEIVRASAKAKQEPALFPVKLIRNYHPINDFLIGGEPPTVEQRTKVFSGMAIEVDKAEAMDMIAKGIAVRNDPIY